MSTAYHVFCALPQLQQVPLVWVEGTFIARRWEEEDGISLYHMAGNFFCEVYLDPESLDILEVRAFIDSERLQDYACYVSLNDLIKLIPTCSTNTLPFYSSPARGRRVHFQQESPANAPDSRSEDGSYR